MTDIQQSLAAGLHANAEQWKRDGSPFYWALAHHLADDVAAGGPCWPVLQAHAAHPLEEVPGVRLLAGVHRLVLQGRAPALVAHYPSVGGDGDAEAAWPAFYAAVDDHAEELAAWVDHVPQTNEVGRSMALVGGWLAAAELFGLPVRLLEPGCSAGLNLRADHYWYEQGGVGWGDPDSTVQFVDRWRGGIPSFDAPLEIVDRRGGDEHPLDAAADDDRLTLLAYVFADELERFDVLRNALDTAKDVPLTIDHADGVEWITAQLADLPAGQTTVLTHSYFWQYLDEERQTRARAAIEAAGKRATADAPLAWVTLEAPGSDYAQSELRLRAWPPDEEWLLGHCLVHPKHVDWIDQTA